MPWDPLESLSAHQRAQLDAFGEALARLNKKINLVSRASIPDLATRHLWHSLVLTRRRFLAGQTVVDWGAGGGLPSIPLAIAFPDVSFVAVDAVGKKMQAVRAIAREIGVTNLEAWHGRAEAWPGKTLYSVSRATAPLEKLWGWHQRCTEPASFSPGDDEWHPGLIVLKGGDLQAERDQLLTAYPGLTIRTTPLDALTPIPYFAEKCILEVFQDS